MNGLVAVSGSTGFLGSRLVALLLSAGFRVRALHRRKNDPEELAALACETLEIVHADLGKPADLFAALKGVDTVIHAAALARDWGPRNAF